MTFSISVVRSDEPDLLAEIHKLTFAKPWRSEEVKALLAMPGMVSLVAMTPTNPVGLIMVLCTGEEAEIVTLAVIPSHQRRGVGRALMESARRTVARAGGRIIHLEVAENNNAARSLYADVGMKIVGRRKNYFKSGQDGAPVNAILMSLPCE